MVEFRLLGPVEVWVGGRPLDLGTVKQRGVLAALLVDVGRSVDVETLIDRVWDTDVPAQARNALYAHLSRIRGLLAQVDAAGVPATLDRRSGGYAVEVEPDRVDVHRMRRLADRARSGELPDDARAALGWTYGVLGGFDKALAYSQDVLPLFVELDDLTGQAATLHSIGYAYHHLGRYRQAAAAYRRAEGIAHDLGDRFQEGMILDHLGDSHDAAGEVDAACAAWRRAMHILSGLGHPDAETVRVKLGQRERTDR